MNNDISSISNNVNQFLIFILPVYIQNKLCLKNVADDVNMFTSGVNKVK